MTVPSLAPGSPDALGTLFDGYTLGAAFDEMFSATREPHPQCLGLIEGLRSANAAELEQYQLEADKAFLTQGITFTVYGDEQGTERIMPFDLLPRIITAADWRILALVDGRSSVADIIGSLGMSAFAVCGVLHRLMMAGAVEATG